jgi:hypothetical protein
MRLRRLASSGAPEAVDVNSLPGSERPARRPRSVDTQACAVWPHAFLPVVEQSTRAPDCHE